MDYYSAVNRAELKVATGLREEMSGHGRDEFAEGTGLLLSYNVCLRKTINGTIKALYNL